MKYFQFIIKKMWDTPQNVLVSRVAPFLQITDGVEEEFYNRLLHLEVDEEVKMVNYVNYEFSVVSVGLQVLVSGLPWVTWISTHPYCKPIWGLDRKNLQNGTQE
jgi:hypothetical protein